MSNLAPGPRPNPSLESIPGHSWTVNHWLCLWPLLLGCWLMCSFYHLKINHELQTMFEFSFLLSLIQISSNIWKAKLAIVRGKNGKTSKNNFKHWRSCLKFLMICTQGNFEEHLWWMITPISSLPTRPSLRGVRSSACLSGAQQVWGWTTLHCITCDKHWQ